MRTKLVVHFTVSVSVLRVVCVVDIIVNETVVTRVYIQLLIYQFKDCVRTLVTVVVFTGVLEVIQRGCLA